MVRFTAWYGVKWWVVRALQKYVLCFSDQLLFFNRHGTNDMIDHALENSGLARSASSATGHCQWVIYCRGCVGCPGKLQVKEWIGS